jgi:hypothetical protein
MLPQTSGWKSALKTEAVCFSGKLVTILLRATQCRSPEAHNMNLHHHENIESHNLADCSSGYFSVSELIGHSILNSGVFLRVYQESTKRE